MHFMQALYNMHNRQGLACETVSAGHAKERWVSE